MGLILPVKGVSPILGEENWVAPNATIVGDVQTGKHCTIWFNAVVRGDVNSIRIGNYSNIQDGAVVHCTYQKTVTTIGDYVSIAHNAIVHGQCLHRRRSNHRSWCHRDTRNAGTGRNHLCGESSQISKRCEPRCSGNFQANGL